MTLLKGFRPQRFVFAQAVGVKVDKSVVSAPDSFTELSSHHIHEPAVFLPFLLRDDISPDFVAVKVAHYPDPAQLPGNIFNSTSRRNFP